MAMITNFPSPPSIPLPTWATNGAKSNPGATKRSAGWVYNPSTGMGEFPPMEWVNFEAWNTGMWVKYFSDVSSYFRTQFTTGKMGSSFFSATPARDGVIVVAGGNSDIDLDFFDNLYMDKTLLTNTNLNVFSKGFLFTPPISGVYEIDCNINVQLSYPPNGSTVLSTPTIYLRTSDGVIRGSQVFPVYAPYLFSSSDTLAPLTFSINSRWVMYLNVGSSISLQYNVSLGNNETKNVSGTLIASGSYVRYSWNNSQPYYNP